MSNPLPREYLPLYADRLKMFGELTVSGSVAAELLRGYSVYLTQRMTLEQMAQGGASNVDMARWAANTIRDDRPVLARVRTRKRGPGPV